MVPNVVLIFAFLYPLGFVLSLEDYTHCNWFDNRNNAPIYPIGVCNAYETDDLLMYSTKLECDEKGQLIQFDWNNTRCSGSAYNHGTHCKEDGYRRYPFTNDDHEFILCDEYCSCNDLVIEFNKTKIVPFIYLRCIGSNSCSNLTINVFDTTEDLQQVDIICKGNNACSYLTINGGYIYESFSLQCININGTTTNNVCNNLYLDIVSTKTINITCDEYGCSDIFIFALEADVVSVNATGSLALVNSTVYVPNAKQLDVACVSMLHNGRTCFNLSLYLSSTLNGNTLKCQFGCERMNLHFPYDINMALFKSIRFTECAVCQTISDCMDKWRISYNYNNIEYSVFYYGNVADIHYDDPLWELSSYIDDQYICPIDPRNMSNVALFGVSFVLCIICIFMMFTCVICLFQHLFIKCYYQYNHIHVWFANRPSMLVFLYSISTKIIVYIVMLWWIIKVSLFADVVAEYCGSKYLYSDLIYCANDEICRYNKWSTRYVKCKDRELGKFVLSVSAVLLWVACWVISKISANLSCIYKISIHEYEKRQFWINKNIGCCETSYFCCNTCEFTEVDAWCYIAVQLISYGILTLMILIFVLIYGHYDSDYVIKPYEFYTVLALIISRIVLELWYTNGPEYDPAHQQSIQIHIILDGTFGSHIAYIIKMYLPLFYDHSLCSSDMVIKQQDSIELSVLRSVDDYMTCISASE